MGTPSAPSGGRIRIKILSCVALALFLLCTSLLRLTNSTYQEGGAPSKVMRMIAQSSFLPNYSDTASSYDLPATTKSIQHCNCSAISLPHQFPGNPVISQMCRGPFRSSLPSEQRRLAVVVRGESFRGLLGMYDRSMEVNRKSFECQQVASKSHVTYVIEPFESCGFVVDVFLGAWRAHDKVWTRNSSQQLMDFYGKRVVAARFLDHRRFEKITAQPLIENPQANNYNMSLLLVAEYSHAMDISYDAIIVVRFDLIFKKSFLVAPYDTRPWEKVMFAFREWLRDGRADMVADTIHWFPWKFANCGYLEGFREHFSGAIFERIGKKNLDFIDTGHHDANAMIDWNPLYKQCRPEQVYDFLGGYAIIAFGIEELDVEKFKLCGQAVASSMARQGIPATVPNVLTSFHGYITSTKKRLRLDKVMMDFWPTHAPHAKVYDVPNKSWVGPSSSGWFSTVRALARGFYQAMKHPNTKVSDEKYKGYQFDRIIFVRTDYAVTMKFLDAYACDTRQYICVGFGAAAYSTVPVFAVTSHVIAQAIAQSSLPSAHLEASGQNQSKAMEVLGTALNINIKILCTSC